METWQAPSSCPFTALRLEEERWHLGLLTTDDQLGKPPAAGEERAPWALHPALEPHSPGTRCAGRAASAGRGHGTCTKSKWVELQSLLEHKT